MLGVTKGAAWWQRHKGSEAKPKVRESSKGSLRYSLPERQKAVKGEPSG